MIDGGGLETGAVFDPQRRPKSNVHRRTWFVFGMEPKSATFLAEISSANRSVTMDYLRLTNDEWERSGRSCRSHGAVLRRPRDRAAVAAFLFCRAAG